MKKKKAKKIGIIPQVAILFLIGVLITGAICYLSEVKMSNDSVISQTERRAGQLSSMVKQTVFEFPAYRFLLKYWYDHADSLDLEYDVTFSEETKTEGKCRVFSSRHPDLELRYVTEEEAKALPADDQKLFAEIAYSWLITGINEIKRSNHIDFLFCVAASEPYDTQFFMFSAADKDAVRGTSYEEVYPLGNVVTVAESQQTAMKNALSNESHLADAGIYVDYYEHLCSFDDKAVFLGMTYSLADLRADMNKETVKGTLFAMTNHLFLSSIMLFLLFLFVLRPLRKVQKNIRLYRETKDSATVVGNLSAVRAHNELGQLAEDVSDLVTEIDDHLNRIQTITAEKERISTELTLATRIQAAMLPHVFPPFPERSEFELFASMDPAKEVGGDFYDFFFVDDDHLCLVIADVSGKGVPAALFMMASKIVLANNAKMGKSPARVLADTNASICRNNQEEMFVTVWLGILEISTGKLTAANAGHEYPVIKHADGRYELFKDRHGFVLGGMEMAKYHEYEVMLEPGSALFLYTDGVPEATNSENELFGTERMVSALNEDPNASPDAVLRCIRSHVDDFVQDAEQFDDLTMLSFLYKGADMGLTAENELVVEASDENLETVLSFVGERLSEVDVSPKAEMQINVAVEEIFVNIAHYAYAPEIGKATVRVEVGDDPVTVTITFIDNGIPYDPLKKEDPDITLSAEERQIGGLGIFMTKQMMDDITYEYKNGQNILSIRKNL